MSSHAASPLRQRDVTIVELEHGGLPSQESAERHALGWTGVLHNLARRVFAGAR